MYFSDKAGTYLTIIRMGG